MVRLLLATPDRSICPVAGQIGAANSDILPGGNAKNLGIVFNDLLLYTFPIRRRHGRLANFHNWSVPCTYRQYTTLYYSNIVYKLLYPRSSLYNNVTYGEIVSTCRAERKKRLGFTMTIRAICICFLLFLPCR